VLLQVEDDVWDFYLNMKNIVRVISLGKSWGFAVIKTNGLPVYYPLTLLADHRYLKDNGFFKYIKCNQLFKYLELVAVLCYHCNSRRVSRDFRTAGKQLIVRFSSQLEIIPAIVVL
jgi:hypothetical protein